jgi:probable F420-dependent oxidoreductase
MRIDAVVAARPRQVGEVAVEYESSGYDGLWVGESTSDVFIRAALVAEHTSNCLVGTSVAVALARNPMTVSIAANDLQELARGRFVLGLGSQVRAHIERRFSMPWSQPASRMREFVLAVRAIFDSWAHDSPLRFNGSFYTHTLMTRAFRPDRHQWPAPPVYLAGVGERMTAVAGEVADGYLFHSFHTPLYLERVVLPALELGRARAGQGRGPFAISGPVLIATGRDQRELGAAAQAARKHIAFYASTPQYRAVLDCHGWGPLHDRLRALARDESWEAMSALISDEVLHAFAIVGEPARIAREVQRRYERLATRLSLYAAGSVSSEVTEEIAASVRALCRTER